MPNVRHATLTGENTLTSGPSMGSRVQGKAAKQRMGSKLIFVLGGARSGKSSFALRRGKALSPRAFLATAEAFDSEMARRIRNHKRARGQGWATMEVPIQLTEWFLTEGIQVFQCSYRLPNIVVE